MRSGVTTEVFVPIDANNEYVQLTAYVYHRFPLYGCIVITPFTVAYANRITSTNGVSKLAFTYRSSGTESPGLYTMKCIGFHWGKILTVSLYIRFITSKFSRSYDSLEMLIFIFYIEAFKLTNFQEKIKLDKSNTVSASMIS